MWGVSVLYKGEATSVYFCGVCVCVLDMFLVTYIVCGRGRVRRGAQVVSV